VTLRRITAAQARLLRLAVEVDIPRRMEDWLDRLDQGVVTTEMRDVLEAFGYLDREEQRQRKPKTALDRPCYSAANQQIRSTTGTSSVYIPTTTNVYPQWHSCNCWGPCHCHPLPQHWCGTCCRYTYSWHYHPVVCHDFGRDERLREEGRRQERERQGRKRHRPYVDVTPALPRHGCR
jgi:hypothetical protein